MEKSIFTRIIDGELPGYIVHETDTVVVLLSLEGHPLVVPRKPYPDIYALDDEVAAEIMQETVRISRVVQSVTKCDGINIVQSNGAVAGQEVFHFHLHIKPRFAGDGVVLAWNTETKPESERAEFATALQKELERGG